MSKCPVVLIGGYAGYEVHHVFPRQEVSPAFDLFTNFDLYTRKGVWYRIARVNVAGFLYDLKTFPRGTHPCTRPLDGRLNDHLSKMLLEWVEWHQGGRHLMVVDHHGICQTIHEDDLSEYTMLSEIERLKYDWNVIHYKEAIRLTDGERYLLRSLNSVKGLCRAVEGSGIKPSPYWVKTHHYGYAITDEGHRLAEWIDGNPNGSYRDQE